MNNLIELEGQNQRLKQELSQLQQHQKNLEGIFNQIISAKAFKFWQGFNKVKKLTKQVVLNPKKILKVLKILFTQEPIWLKKDYLSTSEVSRETISPQESLLIR